MAGCPGIKAHSCEQDGVEPSHKRRMMGGQQTEDRAQMAAIIELLDRLHRLKDRSYGDAWRRRGEVLGIFANIARKADRLERARLEPRPATAENLIDTIADLIVYAAKYLTWLAETQPDAFEAVAPSPAAGECSAVVGPEALAHVLRQLPGWEEAHLSPRPEGVVDAWERTRSSFAILDAGMIAQADLQQDRCLGWTDKVEIAWALTDASAWLLVRIVQLDPKQLDATRRDINRMESSE